MRETGSFKNGATKKRSVIDRRFLTRTATIALPVALQTLITTSINTADTIMISTLGSVSIAAVGLVNQFVFLFQIICFGIGGAGAVFFAQYFGKGDSPTMRRYLSMTLHLVIGLGFFFMLLSLLVPEAIMRFLSPDMQVIARGVGYLRAIAVTFPAFAIANVLNTALRSVNRAHEPLIISIVAFFTNVFFNYVFIFGKFGAPALGILGAAVGTVLARGVEVGLLAFLLSRPTALKADARPLDFFCLHVNLFRQFRPIATPIILAETSWAIAQLMFAVAYARIGTQATAAVQLTTTINGLFFILSDALCAAAAVLLGQSLGAGRREEAERMASGFMRMVTVVGALSLIILAVLPNQLLLMFGAIDPDVHAMSRHLLIIRGLVIPFRYWNTLFIVGIFRAGADSKIPFFIEFAIMWLYAMPIAFLGSMVLGWSVEMVYGLVALEEVLKLIFFVWRYRKKIWVRTLTMQSEDGIGVEAR